MINYLNLIKGNIINRSSYDYNKSKLVWNKRINRYPNYIIYPLDKIDIVNCLKFTKDYNLPFRIRNGGHNYEGYSVLNNGIVIDLSSLNNISIDEENNKVIAESGVKNKKLYDFLIDRGYIFPGGDCPNVGISGYTLGGGWNYSSRLMGLGVDQLIEIELINYRGETLIANEEINPDLFWACRGAGQGNFGLITKFTYKLPPKINQVVYITINSINSDFNTASNIFELWQDWLENLDNRLTLSISFEKYLNIFNISGRGLFYGSLEEVKKIMSDYTQIREIDIDYKVATFKEAIEDIMSISPKYERMNGFGLFNYQKYNKCEIDEILSVLNQKAYHTTLTLYTLGGKIKDTDIDSTAFYHRKANYIISLKTSWENDDKTIDNLIYVCNCYQQLKKYTIGAYINNPYANLDNYMYDYYNNHANKLQAIKNKYDPENFFNFEQSIK